MIEQLNAYYDRFIHLLSYIENAEEVGHTGCNGNYY